MKRYYKRILAVMLTLIMAFSYMPENVVYAAGAASGSTESVDDPVEDTVNAEVYFVQSGTKKIITLDGVVDNPIDCKTVYDGVNVPDNGRFTVYYGKGTTDKTKGITVVNFTNPANDTSWKADNDNVFQMGKRTEPAGWESVWMEPQGDGTVSFRSCANGKYFSVEAERLKLVKLDKGEKVSSNEKFTLYTKTKPKTAKKVTISNISGDSVSVSWQGVDECLYSGYEVLYSASENGEYKSAGMTADTTLDVKNLNLNTKYFFKVRTITNNDGGVYADSAKVYATTLSDYKPSEPADVTIRQNSDETMEINWAESASAKGYKVYRAESRFAEYKEIADVGNEKTYIDYNPNESRYKNYYKIQAYNDVDKSNLSEPASLEISMFGKNTYVFADTDDRQEINKVAADIFEKQHYTQFGDGRYALAFKAGDYTDTSIINVGYYTQILGLGKIPNDVKLYNVHAPAALSDNNATCNFWVGIENVRIADVENNGDGWFNFNWGVSQAAPARRLYVERKSQFDWFNGWASGGFVADTYFEKPAGSYSQQQYYYRNCYAAQGVYGINWNQVIQGCEGVNPGNSEDNSHKPLDSTSLIQGNGTTNWNERGVSTIIDNTPEIREKPFLYFDEAMDEYKVFVPAMRKNSTGISWSESSMGEGTSLSVDRSFYIANPDIDTAESINYQLDIGKNIIFRPGIYHVSEPIKVTRSNTILLGMGIATIIPDNEDSAIKISDVGGVSVAGLVLDSGNYSKTLLTVGEEGCNKDHSDNPVVLQDVIYRVGGTGSLGRCDSCLVVNSNDVIIDHTWIWRADHGDHTGWNENTSKNGLIVNGDNVTAYGLFCEHFQEYDIIWRGENGATYFLQNEKCYDPQSQEGWMSHDGTRRGYAAYKVANNVKKHYAVGLGVYDVFINTNGASIYLDNAIEVPDTPDVLIENACIVEIAGDTIPKVGINHIINNTTAGIRAGVGNNGGYAIQRLLSYQNNVSKSLEDYYSNKDGTGMVTEPGVKPTDDKKAEKDIIKDLPSKDVEKPIWGMTDDDYNSSISKDIVPVPIAITDLVYNGTPQTGVASTGLYTVENNVASEAGNYIAKVTLKDPENYQWSRPFDGSVRWRISKREIQITELAALNRQYEKGNVNVAVSGGKIDGIIDADKNSVSVILPVTGVMSDDLAGNRKTVTTAVPEITGDKSSNYVIGSINKITVNIGAIVVKVPEAVTEFVYNGQLQTVLNETDQYTVSENAKTNAGNYVAKITLKDSTNYKWETEFDGNIPWSIDKRGLQITGLTAENRTYEKGNSKVVISGGALSGVLVEDEAEVKVTMPVTGQMEDDNAGEHKTVQIIVPQIIGAKRNNYVIESINPVYADIGKITVEIPNVVEGLIYDGTEHIGVPEREDYTVENNAGTNAGEYVAKITLNDAVNYQWNTEFDGNIPWSISKKKLTITGLTAIDREYQKGDISVALSGGFLGGIVSGDEGDVVVVMPDKGRLSSDAAGEKLQVLVDIPEITGVKKDNYVIGSINEVFVNIKEAATTAPSETTKTNDISDKPTTSDVQSGLKAGAKFNVGKYTYKITKITGSKASVTLVKVRAKYRNKLRKAVIKSTVKYKGYNFKVTKVGKKAFAKCRRLKHVTIGKNVSKIYAKAFYQSKKLKKITFKGSKLKKISKNAFYKNVRVKLKIKAKKKVKKRILKSLKRIK